MYLGEITRNILLHFIDLSLLFDGHSSSSLNKHYGHDASLVSKLEGANSDEEVRKIILKDLEMDPDYLTDGCVEIVKWACNMVAGRACALAACAIAAVILHTGNDIVPEGEEDKGVDVGVDGR